MRTSISISDTTRDELRKLGSMKDTYDTVIYKLISRNISDEVIALLNDKKENNESYNDIIKRLIKTVDNMQK